MPQTTNNPELSPFEMWMVKSNLKTISNGTPAETIVATLRHNGYIRVANAVEEATKEPTDAEFLRDLAERLRSIPVMYGVDGGDIDRLEEMAAALHRRDEQARQT